MSESQPMCSIFGGIELIPSLAGRVAENGQPPKCSGCSSLERHRIVHKIINSLPLEMLAGKTALQFSNDPGFPKKKLAAAEISIFNEDNSLDIENIAKPDGSYDWVIANHILEHVADDKAALSEMLRVSKPDGIVQITVPTPHSQLWTEDWGYSDSESYDHYRGYGSDLPLNLGELRTNISGVQVIGWDSVIADRWDIVYFFSPTRLPIDRLGKILRKKGYPVIAATK